MLSSLDRKERLRLLDVINHGDTCIEMMRGVSETDFLGDRKLQLAIERLIEIMGEAAHGVSERTRSGIPIDWAGLRGIRNVLVHQYGKVDHRLVFLAATEAVPAMIERLRKAVL